MIRTESTSNAHLMSNHGRQGQQLLKRIPIDQLRCGMFIHEFCASWLDHPFWRSAFLLDDPATLKRISDSGVRELWIDIARGLDVAETSPPEQAQAIAETPAIHAQPVAPRLAKRTSLHEELAHARKVHTRSTQAVVSMFSEIRMGKAVSAEKAMPLVIEIAESIERNPGALISLARLKTADAYTYMHSVAVCALMIALARQLKLPETEVEQAGLAGLMHDLGKALMPLEVLNKPGKLTEAEFAIIKSHPVKGHEILLEGAAADPITLDVCLHHHEKVDGSGYPHGLKGESISLFARMGAVCDVYDAITSNRPYKSGWDPAESIKKMASWSKGHFDDQVFHAFVRSVGIYPVGSLVRLESGRIGIVTELGDKSLVTPKVKVFYSTKSDGYIKPESVDLAKPGCADRILCAEDPSRWHFKNLDEMWLT